MNSFHEMLSSELRENAFLAGVDSAVQQLDGARVQSKGSSSLELATLNLLGLLPPLLGLQGHFALVEKAGLREEGKGKLHSCNLGCESAFPPYLQSPSSSALPPACLSACFFGNNKMTFNIDVISECQRLSFNHSV